LRSRAAASGAAALDGARRAQPPGAEHQPRGRRTGRRLPARAARTGEHPFRGGSLARELTPTQDVVLGRIRRRAWSARWHAPPACRGQQSRRDSFGTPEDAKTLRRTSALSSLARFAAPALLAAAWQSRLPPDDSRSPFLSDPRRQSWIG